jgi:hypothetical protein
VQWKGRKLSGQAKVRLEVRGEHTPPKQKEQFEQALGKSGWFSKWAALRIEGKDSARLGRIRAWRVTLWEGDQQLAEQKSFLW